MCFVAFTLLRPRYFAQLGASGRQIGWIIGLLLLPYAVVSVLAGGSRHRALAVYRRDDAVGGYGLGARLSAKRRPVGMGAARAAQSWARAGGPVSDAGGLCVFHGDDPSGLYRRYLSGGALHRVQQLSPVLSRFTRILRGGTGAVRQAPCRLSTLPSRAAASGDCLPGGFNALIPLFVLAAAFGMVLQFAQVLIHSPYVSGQLSEPFQTS